MDAYPISILDQLRDLGGYLTFGVVEVTSQIS
jgi:hypothetical protein